MKYKSLLEDEIEIRIVKDSMGFHWSIDSERDFGFIDLSSAHIFKTYKQAKSDAISCAKRNGWKGKVKFV